MLEEVTVPKTFQLGVPITVFIPDMSILRASDPSSSAPSSPRPESPATNASNNNNTNDEARRNNLEIKVESASAPSSPIKKDSIPLKYALVVEAEYTVPISENNTGRRSFVGSSVKSHRLVLFCKLVRTDQQWTVKPVYTKFVNVSVELNEVQMVEFP